jgi:hypothetical protein
MSDFDTCLVYSNNMKLNYLWILLITILIVWFYHAYSTYEIEHDGKYCSGNICMEEIK